MKINDNVQLLLCDTHDTSILLVDTYVTIPVSPRSRYTAVYRSSTKYRETAQVAYRDYRRYRTARTVVPLCNVHATIL